MKSCSLSILTLVSAAVLAAGLLALPPTAFADATSTPAEPALVPVTATGCPTQAAPGRVTCLSEALPVSDADADAAIDTDAPTSGREARPKATALTKTDQYTPGDLASLYRIPSDLAPNTTIGIVDVGHDPNTEAQMAYFRSRFGLAACTSASGCFREVAEDGGSSLPATDSDWVVEIAIDVQAVSAICPSCHILLVDSSSAGVTDMARATLTATRLGAAYVSLSFGSAESTGTASLRNTYYSNPDVTYVAAAGDGGYGEALFPASAPNVVAAGGTSVQLVAGVWHQRAWSGSGSGCSSQQAMSSLQAALSLGTMCNGKRVVADLAALADPETGMLFYRGGGWYMGGGTSLAAPILTSLYALAGNHTAPMSVYTDTSALIDVTSGSTGTCSPARMCTATAGWDGPTGLGTPSGLAGLAAGANVPRYVTPTTSVLRGGGGYPTRMTYRLGDTVTGAAIVGAKVVLQRRTASGTFATLQRTTTDGNGEVYLADTPTRATAYRVVFAGNDLYGASTTSTLTVAAFRPKVRLHRLRGRIRASVRAPWGRALRSATVRLEKRRGHTWVVVRRLRTDRHGIVTTAVRRGSTYRLEYGGGAWLPGHTAAIKAR